jgi:multicomponent Na+:H+ antiporter subunit F
VNGWLWAATVLTSALVPLIAVVALAPPLHRLVAVEAAGTDAALVMLLISEGTESQSFATLALILAAMGFIGSIAFIRFLERLDR